MVRGERNIVRGATLLCRFLLLEAEMLERLRVFQNAHL